MARVVLARTARFVRWPDQMVIRRYRDLFCWQLADEFKQQIVTIVKASPAAWSDFRYRSQLLEASRAVSKDIAEGFLRKSPGEFAKFLNYALGSLAEAEDRLTDGIEIGYFAADICERAFRLAKRCTKASVRLKQTQIAYAEALRRAPRRT